MTLTVESKRTESSEEGSSDRNQQRSYQYVYRIKQTDSGSRASAQNLITAAQSGSPDPLPIYGDNPNYDGTTDLDSYAQQYTWKRPKPVDQDRLLDVAVDFLPAENVNPGRFSEHDPLLWPTEYWIEWTEEQVVMQEATNVEDLTFALRSALTLGPVTNACGVEFTEPLMKTVYYPVLHCQKAYATLNEIIALNTTYQNTTNNGTYFGAPMRNAKYLITESGHIQKVNGQSFYMGITRIWFKSATWDRKVLNNGWSHFKAIGNSIQYDFDGKAALFRNKVYDDPKALVSDPDSLPDTPCSEPLNLTLDGTIVPADSPGVYIHFRDLTEVSYSGIGIGG